MQVGDTVFGLNTNGMGYTNLFTFNFAVNSTTAYGENGLAIVGNTLYGTTWYGGAYDYGTLFYVTTNGATSGGIMHDFSGLPRTGYDYSISTTTGFTLQQN